MIELLNDLEKQNKLVELYRCGIISSKVIHHREVFLKYDSFIRQGKDVTDAVFLTCVEVRVSESTVYRAIRMMKS